MKKPIYIGSFVVIALILGYGVLASLPNQEQALATQETQAEQPQTPDPEEPKKELSEGVTRYKIHQQDSEVRFTIDEVLRGKPVTVVGATNEVSGGIELNRASPDETSIGEITVDAATLQTDSNHRNEMINWFILNTADYPEITYDVKNIEGLPEQIEIGETYNVTLSGALYVRGVTKSVDFDGEFELTDEDTLTGTAETTILYPDFGISIPSVPFVASVEDEVGLSISFTANKLN